MIRPTGIAHLHGGGKGRSTTMPTGDRLKNNCSLLSPTSP